jgi:hypothetical protein
LGDVHFGSIGDLRLSEHIEAGIAVYREALEAGFFVGNDELGTRLSLRPLVRSFVASAAQPRRPWSIFVRSLGGWTLCRSQSTTICERWSVVLCGTECPLVSLLILWFHTPGC